MVNIFDLISWIETKNSLCAVRFEPAVFKNISENKMSRARQDIINNIAKIHNCSNGTAMMIYSSSWGASQVMGFNLYDQSICDSRFNFYMYLGDGIEQARATDAFLRHVDLDQCTSEMLADDHHERLNFAIKYNGAIAYEKPMIDALKHFGLEIK